MLGSEPEFLAVTKNEILEWGMANRSGQPSGACRGQVEEWTDCGSPCNLHSPWAVAYPKDPLLVFHKANVKKLSSLFLHGMGSLFLA